MWLHHVGAKSALLRHFLCHSHKKRHPPAPLLLLFQNRSRSLRLFACKRAHDASRSLPTCFGCESSIPTSETLKISFSCGLDKWTLDEHLLFQRRFCREGVALMSKDKRGGQGKNLDRPFCLCVHWALLCSFCHSANSFCPCSLA